MKPLTLSFPHISTGGVAGVLLAWTALQDFIVTEEAFSGFAATSQHNQTVITSRVAYPRPYAKHNMRKHEALPTMSQEAHVTDLIHHAC